MCTASTLLDRPYITHNKGGSKMENTKYYEVCGTPYPIEICGDCLRYISNGVEDGEQFEAWMLHEAPCGQCGQFQPDEVGQKGFLDVVDSKVSHREITIGRTKEQAPDGYTAQDKSGDDGSFSKSPCDCCGTTLAGDRYLATEWDETL